MTMGAGYVERLETEQHQTTIAESVEIEGIGTFSGLPSRVRLEPAATDEGIVFVVDGVSIPCSVENLAPQDVHTTGVGSRGVAYRSIEHLLAAFRLLGIDNCRVVALEGDELPNPAAGACSAFTEPLERAGVVYQDGYSAVYRFTRSGSFAWERSTARFEPLPVESGLELEVTIDFPQPVGRQCVRWSSSARTDDHRDAFVNARGILRRDLGEIRPSGDDHWVEVRKTVRGLPDDISLLRHMAFRSGDWVVGPSFEYEPAWHKLMDFVGDLHLIGGRLTGRLSVELPGHAFNHKLVRTFVGDDAHDASLTAALD
jgi:UDP-3-O-[3-hydroxymyristoyl] N-acetylglucosamine deacetylase